ncbi:MAG: hypothetical protein L6U16_11010 [Porphyromonadaceae bacterium]|nr:MAG: hypothetical protein L6U16_11010 [Porphyromonadaceae bacterium]
MVRLLDEPDLRMPLTENTVVKLQSVSVKIQNPDEAPEVRLLSKMRSIAFDGGVVSGIADVKTSASQPSFSVSGDVFKRDGCGCRKHGVRVWHRRSLVCNRKCQREWHSVCLVAFRCEGVCGKNIVRII